jgi:hypothetical protein
MIIRLVIVCLVSIFLVHGQAVQCRPPGPTRSMIWGHDHVTVEMSSKPLKNIRGTVRALVEQPVADVLVEVLHLGPSESPAETSDDARMRRRLASCITAGDGKFGFDLPPGRYQLLFSKPDWNSTSVNIAVSKKGKLRNIVVPLKIGD